MNPQDGSLQKKTSFYYALLLLPRERRAAMETLYRYCWAADEIADGPGKPGEKERRLRSFEKELKACFSGSPRSPLFKRLQGVIRRFSLSPEPLERTLRGVARDLEPLRFKTFRELRAYALQVAGGPGLSSMEIFGFKDRLHRLYAENLGLFLQIVNIVRDWKEDGEMGRRYLPLEDLRRFRLDPFRVRAGDPAWDDFIRFQLDRALGFLKASRRALSLEERAELPTAEAIALIYEKLESKLRARPRSILEGRVYLSFPEKLSAAVRVAGRRFYPKGFSA